MRSSSALGSVAVVNKDHVLRSSSSVGVTVDPSSSVVDVDVVGGSHTARFPTVPGFPA